MNKGVIMKLENQVVCRELSQKIEKLGVKQESVWAWMDWHKGKYSYRPDVAVIQTKLAEENEFYKEKVLFSAFTVAELGEILPKIVKKNGIEFWLTMYKQNNFWRIGYNENQLSSLCEHTKGDTEANARAKMLIYLIEKKLIKV